MTDDAQFRGWVHCGTVDSIPHGADRRLSRFGIDVRVTSNDDGTFAGLFEDGRRLTKGVRVVGGVIFLYHAAPADTPGAEQPIHGELVKLLESHPIRRSSEEYVSPTSVISSSDNAVDVAHFPTVHRSAISSIGAVSWKAADDRFEITTDNRVRPFGMKAVFRYTSFDAYNSLANNEVGLTRTSWQLGLGAPRGDGTTDVLLITGHNTRTQLHARCADLTMRLGARRARREDNPIWKRQTYLPQPQLSDADGPILQFRKWRSRFAETIDATDLVARSTDTEKGQYA